MCCDLAIASDTAVFSQRQQRTGFGGLSMGWQHIQLLTIGYKRMREWQLTGRTLNAEEAKDWSVINSIVPEDQLDDEVMRWASAVVLNPADSLMIGKTHMQVMFDLLGMNGPVRRRRARLPALHQPEVGR